MAIFQGAGVAIVTPFHENGEVNYEQFAKNIDWQIANGSDAIIVCGTTGDTAVRKIRKLRDLGNVPARLLDPDDIVHLFYQLHDRFGQEITAGSPRHIIENDRQLYRFCSLRKMLIKSFLCRFVIIGRH